MGSRGDCVCIMPGKEEPGMSPGYDPKDVDPLPCPYAN